MKKYHDGLERFSRKKCFSYSLTDNKLTAVPVWGEEVFRLGSAQISLFTTSTFENFWHLDNAHIQITIFLRTAENAHFYGINNQISITKSL